MIGDFVGGRLRLFGLLVLALLVLAPAGSVMAHSEFSDLDEAGPHRAAIENLAELGVLEGTECGPEEFCPGDPLKRWVMAVWLVRVLDGEDPGAGPTRFSDVDDGQWWAPYVERLAVLGVTVGCATNPARYCPEDSVTRAQMATFLTRAIQGGGPGSGPGPGGGSSEPGTDEYPDVLEGAGVGHVQAPIVGDWVIPVFVCAPRPGVYTAADLGELTAVLNAELGSFFEQLSSGLMTLRFSEGSVLTDAGFDWESKPGPRKPGLGEFPCGEEATGRSGTNQILIFAHVEGRAGGLARLRSGPALVRPPLRELRWVPFRTVIHELAHSVLGLHHLKGAGAGNVFVNETDVVADFLADGRQPTLTCYQYEQLGWSVPAFAEPCERLTPSPPTSVSVVLTDNAEGVKVTWEPPEFTDDAPVTRYNVRYFRGSSATSEDTPFAVFEEAADARSHLIDASLEPGQFVVTVEAHSRHGEGDRYAVSLSVAPEPPPFGPIRTTNVTHSAIHLAWNTESHANFRDENNANIRYEVQYTAGGQTGRKETWGRNSNFDTTFSLTGLHQSTEYTIRVRACSEHLLVKTCTSWKAITASTSTGSGLPPPAPISTTVGSDWYQVSWDPVPGAESYLIELRFGQLRIQAPDFAEYYGIQPDTSYSLRVRSCRSPTFTCADGDWSTVTFTTTSEPAVPPPYRVALRELGDSWVTLMWETQHAQRSLSRVEYEYTDGTTGSGLLHHRDQSLKPLQITVEPNRTYTLKIRNCELAGHDNSCSAWASLIFSTFPTASPVSPPAVRATDIADIWLGLSWEHVPGAISYDWRYKKAEDPPTWWIWGNETEPRMETWTNLDPGTEYTIEVRSCGDPSKPCSQWTSTTATTVRALPPAPPTYPASIQEVTDTQLRIAWNPPHPGQYYMVRWYPTNERQGRVYTDILFKDRVISGLEPNTAYTIAVRTCRPGAEEPCDNWVAIYTRTRPAR